MHSNSRIVQYRRICILFMNSTRSSSSSTREPPVRGCGMAARSAGPSARLLRQPHKSCCCLSPGLNDGGHHSAWGLAVCACVYGDAEATEERAGDASAGGARAQRADSGAASGNIFVPARHCRSA